jgi:glycosyltransferase involved in cell wall biosynthesis
MATSNNLLVLTIWSYEDALIQAYTLPYVRLIRKQLADDRKMFLVTLEKRDLTTAEKAAIKSSLRSEGIEWLPFRYRPMSAMAILRWFGVFMNLLVVVIRKRISIIHCWCTPAGAIGYGIARVLNRKLVIDSYEPHAEAMVENGTWANGSLITRLLFWFERKQTERADFIISTTEGMRGYAQLRYGITIEKFLVKPACVDLISFDRMIIRNDDLAAQLGVEGKIVCVYAGKLGGIYLDKEVFDFIKVAIDYWGNKFRFLLLTSHHRDEIQKFCKQAGVDPDFVIIKFVSHREVPAYMSLGHFALTPVKPVPTKRYCTPIKDGEYWSLGLPVIIPANISDDSDIILKHDIGAVLPTLNAEAYKTAILKIEPMLHNPALSERIRAVARQYRSFEIAETVYRTVYSKI